MSPDNQLELAREHHRAGRLAEADKLCAEMLNEFPNQPDAMHLRAIVSHDLGRIDLAVDLAAKAATARPENAVFHANHGQFLREAGKHDEAIQSLSRAVELQPAEPSFRAALAVTLADTKQYERAAEQWHRVIELDPKSAAGYASLAGMLRHLNRPQEAMTAIQEAMKRDSQYAVAHHNLGMLLADRGEYTGAIAAFSRAIELFPQSRHSHTFRAQVNLILGDFEHGWAENEWRHEIGSSRGNDTGTQLVFNPLRRRHL